MSNVLRNFQKQKSNKPRKRKAKGPARAPARRPQPRPLGTPKDEDGNERQPDLSLANPSCNGCHGTGLVGTAEQKDKTLAFLVCTCVLRAMHDGNAPWLRKRA